MLISLSDMTTIKHLPDETVVAVLEYLRAMDLASVSEVDKTIFSRARVYKAVKYQMQNIYVIMGTPVKEKRGTSSGPSGALVPISAASTVSTVSTGSVGATISDTFNVLSVSPISTIDYSPIRGVKGVRDVRDKRFTAFSMPHVSISSATTTLSPSPHTASNTPDRSSIPNGPNGSNNSSGSPGMTSMESSYRTPMKQKRSLHSNDSNVFGSPCSTPGDYSLESCCGVLGGSGGHSGRSPGGVNNGVSGGVLVVNSGGIGGIVEGKSYPEYGCDVLYVREIKSILQALTSPVPMSGKGFWISTSCLCVFVSVSVCERECV